MGDDVGEVEFLTETALQSAGIPEAVKDAVGEIETAGVVNVRTVV